jgi:hypothetical protein
MGRVALVIGVLFLVVVPSLGARTPNERGELTAASHGDRDWALLDSYNWCPEGEDFCQGTQIDYAAPDRWDRLPIHPGGVMRLRTGRPARGVSVSFEGTRRSAKQRGDSGRRWRVRVPQSASGKMFLRIVADYRYRKDGKRWGGKYRFFLPVRQHRHD